VPSEDRQARPQPGADAASRRDAQDPAYPVWFRSADRVAAYAPNLAGWAMGTIAIWLLGGRVAATVFLGASTILQAVVTWWDRNKERKFRRDAD
jgi:hypothetical protein